MVTDELTWNSLNTRFERDIDARLAALFKNYIWSLYEESMTHERMSLSALEEKARALMAAGADINAAGVDADDPRERRRLLPAVCRECYCDFVGKESLLFWELLFSLGFNPDLDQGRAGASLLAMITRNTIVGYRAVGYPQALAFLLDKGCRSDLPTPYFCDVTDDKGDLIYHIAERAEDNLHDYDYDSYWLLNAGYYLLKARKDGRPTDGIGSFREAFLSPFECLLIPPGATVTQTDETCWEIRRKRRDEDWYTPSLGFRLRDKALLYIPQELLFCDTPPDGWQEIPLIPTKWREKPLVRVCELEMEAPERLRFELEDERALLLSTRFEEPTKESNELSTHVMTLTLTTVKEPPLDNGDYRFNDGDW